MIGDLWSSKISDLKSVLTLIFLNNCDVCSISLRLNKGYCNNPLEPVRNFTYFSIVLQFFFFLFVIFFQRKTHGATEEAFVW